MLPKVNIIILNWNTLDATMECLNSLKSIDYDNYRIIVVDNGSKENVESLKTKYPDTLLIENKENMGFAGGNNKGIQLSLNEKVDYILLLNSDTIVDKYFLKELVDSAEEHKNSAVFNPKIYFYDKQKTIWFAGSAGSLWTGRFGHIGKGEDDRGQFDKECEMVYATGCAFFMRTSVVKEIGMLDDRFFAYSEDLDWSLRAIEKGYTCYYVPKSKVWHKEAIALIRNMQEQKNKGRTTPLQIYLYFRNKLFIMRKHCSFIQIFTFFITLFCLELFPRIIGFIILNRREKLLKLFKAIGDGLTIKLQGNESNA